MNNNLAPVEEHDTVFAELPWYANGTLPDSLVDRVDRHLSQCTICQKELHLMRKTFESVNTNATPQEQVDQSLAKIMQRIDSYEENLLVSHDRIEQTKSRESSASTQWVEKLRKFFPGSGSLWVPAASLAALAVVSVLSVQLLQTPSDDNYSVLTSGESAALSLRVRFKNAAQPAVVIRMVQTIGIKASVRTVNERVYLINLPADAAISDLNEAFTQFNSHPTVDSVEAVLEPTKTTKPMK